MPTIGNRWWHLRNRSPGTGSTSGLLPEGRFHRPATTCWSASGAGPGVALTRGRNAVPIARPSYDRLPDRVPPVAPQHRAAREYRRYQRTAQRMSAGSVCRHLKIFGRVGISRFFHVVSQGPRKFATQPTFATLGIHMAHPSFSLPTQVVNDKTLALIGSTRARESWGAEKFGSPGYSR
jgi:hypothetical protein